MSKSRDLGEFPAAALDIDASGNLDVTGTVTADGLVVDGDASINRLSTDGVLLDLKKDGTTVGSIGAGPSVLYAGKGSAALAFAPFSETNSAIFPYSSTTNASRDAGIDLGASWARFKNLHLSGGVVLDGAVGTGTSTSNTLDSYEEGTWTPTLDNGTSITYTSQTGRYRKVGAIVYCVAEMVISNSNNASDASAVTVGSLPFTTTSQEQVCIATLGRYIDFLGSLDTALSNIRFTGVGVLLMKGSNAYIKYNEVATSGTLQIAFTYASE